MSLIDADKLKDTLLEHRYTTEHNQIFRYIDEQPTAYDVDKTVEQLKNISYERFGNARMGGENVVNLDDAIEIVKAGGIDDKK